MILNTIGLKKINLDGPVLVDDAPIFIVALAHKRSSPFFCFVDVNFWTLEVGTRRLVISKILLLNFSLVSEFFSE